MVNPEGRGFSLAVKLRNRRALAREAALSDRSPIFMSSLPVNLAVGGAMDPCSSVPAC